MSIQAVIFDMYETLVTQFCSPLYYGTDGAACTMFRNVLYYSRRHGLTSFLGELLFEKQHLGDCGDPFLIIILRKELIP